MNTDEILSRFQGAKRSGDQWAVICPVHDDGEKKNKPSLTVSTGDDGRTLLHCKAGCATTEIVRAVGLTMGDLFTTARNPKGNGAGGRATSTTARDRGRLEGAYDYVDADGKPLYQVRKWRYADGSKKITQHAADGKGGWLATVTGPDPERPGKKKRLAPRVLYRLPELLAADPSATVFVVEGESCCDALRGHGCVATTACGGAGQAWTKEQHSEPLTGRQVVVLPDNDGPGKEHGAKVSKGLYGFAASVKVVELPGLPDKGDVVDWLEQGHTVEELRVLVEAAPEWKASPEGKAPEVPYRVDRGCMCRLHVTTKKNKESGTTEETVEAEPLCNFSAQIVEDVLLDDGIEQSRRFTINGSLATGAVLPGVTVAASEFDVMSWAVKRWGSRVVVFAGLGTRDHLRCAVQALSSAVERTVYAHTGWRKVAGEWIYIHGSGALGGRGAVPDVHVELEAPLDRFVLPADPDDVRGAVGVSLALLGAGPPDVMVPLLAATYLGPLASIVQPDLVLYFAGTTGKLKSEITAQAQRHYGAGFDRLHFPATWGDTSNSIEARLFAMKDAMTVIDDYCPAGSRADQERMAKALATVIRSVGNGAGRGRLRADLSNRPVRPPRGLVVTSGELLPEGHSARARCFVVQVEGVTGERLSHVQANAARLSHAMAGYVQWLAPQLDEIARAAPAELATLRASFADAAAAHLRLPTQLALIFWGFDKFLAYAEDVGALSTADSERWSSTADAVLRRLASDNAKGLRAADPVVRFLDALATLRATGRAHLAEVGKSLEAGPGKVALGWEDGSYVYLLPGEARRAVVMFLRESDEHFPLSRDALADKLVEGGYVDRGPSRIATQCRGLDGVTASRHWVWKLKHAALTGATGAGEGEAA
ncbi:MAG: hypothetical protein IT371_14295 [Deltaproteobacteria bacterium]|nr:hypothetical protein [Deltaproteobacteria bacterium]